MFGVQIDESPQPKWRQAGTGRRLQYLGGNLTKNNSIIPEPLPAYVKQFPDLIHRIQRITDCFSPYSDPLINPLDAESKPSTQRLGDGPNQVLINEYLPGQGISPHEDGPAYQPAVATLSLGSGSCLDIYQYLSFENPSPPLTASSRPDGNTRTMGDFPANSGKAIATVPLSHVFLEPRSLFIMTNSLYQTHLHGIKPQTSDLIQGVPLTPSEPDSSERDDSTTSQEIEGEVREAVKIANQGLLGDEVRREALSRGEVWHHPREKRVSMTFRRIEKISKLGSLMTGIRR